MDYSHIGDKNKIKNDINDISFDVCNNKFHIENKTPNALRIKVFENSIIDAY